MFLNQLKDNHKELFLQLCNFAIMSDGSFDQLEKESLPRLCYEMMLPNHIPNTNEPLDSVLEKLLASCSKQELNIILFEIILLLKSDGPYNDAESEFLDYVVNALQISDEKFVKMDLLTEKYNIIASEIADEIEE